MKCFLRKGFISLVLITVFMALRQQDVFAAEKERIKQEVNMSAMDAEINIDSAITKDEERQVMMNLADTTSITLKGTYLYQEAWEVLELVNKERVKAGVQELTMDKDLLAGAMKRALEVQVYFSHMRPNGESCFSISDKAEGENIAAGNSTAQATMYQWMNSPGHRSNILNSNYNSIGVGCFTQGGVRYWVQIFGTSEGIYTDERQNKETIESVNLISDNIQCQMNIGDPYPLMRGEKEDYDGKFVLINKGWNIACTWILPTTINWSSSDRKIFQVDQNGHMTGVKVGQATLTGQLKNDISITDSVKIQVYDPYGLDSVRSLKSVSAGKNKVLLSWQAEEDAEGYLIYAQKNGKYGYCGMTTKGTTFTDTKALDTDYNFYWVFPYVTDKSTGKIIPGPCEKYVYAKGIIPPVSNLKGASMIGGVKVSWTKSSDADGYLVYGIRDGQKYSYIGMTNGAAFIDKKASKEGYNFYWVFPFHYDKSGKMVVGEITPTYVYGKAR